MSFDPTLIASHHIGGRGGTGSFYVPKPFARDIHHVYYEADADCTEQIAAANEGETVTVLPSCIGRAQGTARFHIDYDPFMSSLLELNPDYGDYTLFLIDPVKGALDYQFSDTGRAMETRELKVLSLDDLYTGAEKPAPSPDILSMDTQGSEWDILAGALGTLSDSVLALRLEVAFNPIYKDQKLFGDISALLHEQGFRFMKILDLYEMHPSREALGLRSGTVDAFGEVLFYRSLDSLLAIEDVEARYLKLMKMAFIALGQNQLEVALACLRALGAEPESLRDVLSKRAYPSFLTGLLELAEAHPKAYPPLFSEVYSFEQSMARFDAEAGFPNMEAQFREIAENLRVDVAERGGSRLCVLPFGLYARAMATTGDAANKVPLAFFDNGWQKHREAGHEVLDPAALEEDDYVIILSQTYGAEIEKQVNRIRGERPERTLSYKDLIAGRWAFDKDSAQTAVERWLEEHEFAALAERVRELRIAQTHKRRVRS